jgi:hypothetical protein
VFQCLCVVFGGGLLHSSGYRSRASPPIVFVFLFVAYSINSMALVFKSVMIMEVKPKEKESINIKLLIYFKPGLITL